MTLSPDSNLLHVKVRITNTGEILLFLVSIEARVQQILPLPDDLAEKLHRNEDLVPEGDNNTEVPWPLITDRRKCWEKKACEIEPGEVDEVDFDFVLPSEVRTVEIYTHVDNAKKRGRELGWGWTTIYEISDRGEEGAGEMTNGSRRDWLEKQQEKKPAPPRSSSTKTQQPPKPAPPPPPKKK